MSKKGPAKRRTRVATSPSANSTVDPDEPRQPSGADSRRDSAILPWRRTYALAPVVLALLTSVNTLWNAFAADDSYQVLQNTLIRKLSNVPFAFTRSVWAFVTEDIVFSVDAYYRPLFSAVFSINYALFGTRAWGWHLVNVLIHAFVAWLVFVVLKELTGRERPSLLAASLFAVHPAHVESVAWVSGVTDPLMAVFVLTSFLFYLRYRETARKDHLALMLVSYFLALLCKETAVALPVVIACCELFYFRDAARLRQRIVRSMTLSALFLVPTIVDILMRYRALGRLLGGSRSLPLGVGLATSPTALVKYLRLMLVPIGYSYQHQTEFVWSVASVEFLGPLAIVVVVGIGIALLRSRLLNFGALWFIALLAPSLYAIRQFEPEYVVQERYLYLPSIGICIAIALALDWVIRRQLFGEKSIAVAASVAALLIIVCGAVSVVQNRVWENDIALYKNVVARDPQRASAHVALARSYYALGRVRDADLEAHTALQLNPGESQAYVSLAYFANSAGKYNQALEYLQQAASVTGDGPRSRNDLATAYLNMGLIYWQIKEYERAEESLLRSVDVWPRAVGWYHLGRFYLERSRVEEARAMFELTARNVPHTYPPIHFQLGRVYDLLGQKDAAKAEYETFLDLAPPGAANRGEVSARLQSL